MYISVTQYLVWPPTIQLGVGAVDEGVDIEGDETPRPQVQLGARVLADVDLRAVWSALRGVQEVVPVVHSGVSLYQLHHLKSHQAMLLVSWL